jgi:hypothetical protein
MEGDEERSNGIGRRPINFPLFEPAVEDNGVLTTVIPRPKEFAVDVCINVRKKLCRSETLDVIANVLRGVRQ